MVLGGVTIAETNAALRVLETSHPPGIYLPNNAFDPGALSPIARTTVCEFKGVAGYWDLVAGDAVAKAAAWSYENPSPGYEAIAGFISVYPGRVDACYLDDELVVPQEGDFYGGWITADIEGPFKGGVGTVGW